MMMTKLVNELVNIYKVYVAYRVIDSDIQCERQ